MTPVLARSLPGLGSRALARGFAQSQADGPDHARSCRALGTAAVTRHREFRRVPINPLSELKKRGRGRAATGRDPMIGLRLPKAEIAWLDKWAKANGYTRSEAIRVLIFGGLKGDCPGRC